MRQKYIFPSKPQKNCHKNKSLYRYTDKRSHDMQRMEHRPTGIKRDSLSQPCFRIAPIETSHNPGQSENPVAKHYRINGQ